MSFRTPRIRVWMHLVICDLGHELQWQCVQRYGICSQPIFMTVRECKSPLNPNNEVHIDLWQLNCKGTYACVRLHRYTYGIYWNTVANVDASDSRCRCIGKIIARDLRLVASRLYRMAVTRPASRAAVTDNGNVYNFFHHIRTSDELVMVPPAIIMVHLIRIKQMGW